MDEHDKGVALPEGFALFDEDEESPSDTESAQRGRERWSRSVQILVALRAIATPTNGATATEVARITKLPLTVVEGILKNTLLRRKKVACDMNVGGRPKTWWIPRRLLKEHLEKMQVQSAEQAALVSQWVRSSKLARERSGMEIYMSYPYSRATSSTTTPTS